MGSVWSKPGRVVVHMWEIQGLVFELIHIVLMGREARRS